MELAYIFNKAGTAGKSAAMHNIAANADAAKDTYSAAPDGRTLLDAEPGQTYIIREINTDDDEMNSFLFRLGCYQGEPITLVSKKKKSCIVVIKDGRYNLDKMLSEAIIL